MPYATQTENLSGADITIPPHAVPLPALLRTPQELAEIVSRFASSDGWLSRVRFRADDRWYERLYHGPDHDIWVISWLPGQSTGFHDHGESAGAFVVATGTLQEDLPGEEPVSITPGQPRSFPSDYAHNVRNVSLGPAISIHAYSPPLSEMNEYELEGSELVARSDVSERAASLDREWHAKRSNAPRPTAASGIEQVLSAARARLHRLSPEDAYDAVTQAGAVLVDIRPEAQRALEGSIPGATIIERNVLEWRFDPTSDARLPIATDHNLQVIVFCSEGYTSSLAAAALQELGLWRATDVVGGFHAWRAVGLPALPTNEADRKAIPR
jgi:rhodanese-related sulfurtransferase/mannose-6-phosphate isomerase-like protein (cupin superfamily)